MNLEIERKFLVKNDSWRTLTDGEYYRQGYLSIDKDRTVRVRETGNQGLLTIKGITKGAQRNEYEYEIPLAEAKRMLDTLCLKPLIEKRRYTIHYEQMAWQVDEFLGENEGLIIAEIELQHADQEFKKPDWLGKEVTADPAYYNANLVRRPYCHWVERRKT